MLLDLHAWLLLCVWKLLGLDVRLLLCVWKLLGLDVQLLLWVWKLLGVWVLGTVCCRLEAPEFELCGLIGRENYITG